MSRWFSHLRTRLILLVVIATLPAFGLIVWTSFEDRQKERDHAEEKATSLAQVIAREQDQFVEGTRQLLGVLAGLSAQSYNSGTNRPIDSEACGRAFTGMLAQDERYANMGIVAPDGLVICSGVPSSTPVNVSDRPWFQEAVTTKQFAIGDYQIGRITKLPTINFGYPVVDANNEVRAVMSAAVDLDWLNAQVAKASLPSDTTLTVFDRHGTVLARVPDPEVWVGTSAADEPIGQAVLSVREGSAELDGLDGRQRLYAFTPFGGADGDDAYVAVGISSASAYAGINQTLQRNLALLGMAALLAIGAAWFFGDWFVVKGVRVLVQATQRLGAGDLSARTRIPHSGGEVNQLAGSFDRMAESLEQREGERRRAEAELALRADDLARSNVALERTNADLARSNSELEQFAYVASHDLQEPLRMVSNYTQLLARRYEGKLDGDADDSIAFAVDGAKRMQSLINDLLAFSRVGTRGKDLAPTDANAVLAQTLVNLQPAIEESGAKVTSDPLPTIAGDDGQRMQLLQNLIANAIKFRGEEPPAIHISASEQGNDYLFSVRDNGIGLDPQYKDRIFVIFQRLHGRDQYPGTGIGLAICRKIVERHGGRIWVESEPGKGATFFFTLACVPARLQPEPARETARVA